MYGWQNEAGEPYMDAAALRLEAELDALSAAERYEEQWYEFGYDDGGDECDVDNDLEAGWCWTHDQSATLCDDGEEYDFPEDAHLDGYYEE